MRLSTQRNKDLTVFALLAAIIISTQLSLQALQGVQLNGLLIAAITVTYRRRALLPIYTYILLYCICFPTIWSIPYLYIWIPLWGAFMLASSRELPKKVKYPLFVLLCGLYGLSFGLLYAPFQAIITGWNFKTMRAWYISGLIFSDIPHAVNNLIFGVFIVPLSDLLKKLQSRTQ